MSSVMIYTPKWITALILYSLLYFRLASSLSSPVPSSLPVEANKKVSTRYIAVKALSSSKGATFSVDRLETDVEYLNLSVRDRSFCRLLVTATERRLGQIDKVLSLCKTEQGNKPSRVDEYIENVLRIGATQIMFLGTSSYAAVKETVDVLRCHPKLRVPESKIKYANAVLRRLTRDGDDLLGKTDIVDNISPWLVEAWNQDWGVDKSKGIIQASMQETPRCITVKQNSESDPTEQSEFIANHFNETEILPQGSIRILQHPPGSVSSWPLYDKGLYWFQDVSATLPALALYKTLSKNGKENIKGKRVVDMCAAPGGKTAQLCSYGFHVTAVEGSERRSRRLKQNLDRLGMNCELVLADGTKWLPDQTIDAVLLDVPCSATGTGSKRPDVLRRDPDISELLDVQFRLASHAIDDILVKDGILIYASCSLLKAESEGQISRILQRDEGARVKVVPFLPGEIPGFDEAIDEEGFIRLVPGVLEHSLGQYDGFFVARLQKL